MAQYLLPYSIDRCRSRRRCGITEIPKGSVGGLRHPPHNPVEACRTDRRPHEITLPWNQIITTSRTANRSFPAAGSPHCICRLPLWLRSMRSLFALSHASKRASLSAAKNHRFSRCFCITSDMVVSSSARSSEVLSPIVSVCHASSLLCVAARKAFSRTGFMGSTVCVIQKAGADYVKTDIEVDDSS